MKKMSSPFTFFQKFIMPILFISLGFYGLARALWEAYSSHVEFSNTIKAVLFIVFWLGGVVIFTIFDSFPMKKVYLNEHSLRVSNYFKEVRIPLLNVKEVKITSLGYFKGITVILKDASEFGRKITFLPGFYYKDAAAEIMRAIDREQSRT